MQERYPEHLLVEDDGGHHDMPTHNMVCRLGDLIQLWLARIFVTLRISSHNAVITGTATDSLAPIPNQVSLPFWARRIDIQLFDNPMIIRRAPPGGEFDEQFELQAPGYYTYTVWTNRVEVQNATAGNNARYTIIIWD